MQAHKLEFGSKPDAEINVILAKFVTEKQASNGILDDARSLPACTHCAFFNSTLNFCKEDKNFFLMSRDP